MEPATLAVVKKLKLISCGATRAGHYALARHSEMMAHKNLDFREALKNPRAVFGIPERLLADPRLDREGKRTLLRTWEQDERELEVAVEEGMTGGEQSLLHRVIKALNSISNPSAVESETTTKHGGRRP